MIHQAAVEYAGAVADGEMDLVPADALAHIRACPVCGREVRWQREVNAGLAGALAADAAAMDSAPRDFRRPVRRWRGLLPAPALVAGSAAAAVLLATAGLLSLGPHGGGNPAAGGADSAMTAAEQAYGTAPALATTDATTVTDWTAAHGMPGMRPPTVTGTSLAGVRGGTVGGRPAMTFLYAGAAGVTEVTALGGPPPPAWPMAEMRMMGGHAVGVVTHGATGMVIVAPDEADLARAMAAVQ